MKTSIPFICTISIALIIVGCSSVHSTATATATTTAVPATATLTSTPTPVPSPTLTTTPSILSASNLANMSEDFRIGKGQISDVFWTQDDHVEILYSTGLTMYDVIGTKILSVQPENKAVSTDSTLSLDGKLVASLVDNKTVLIWDAGTGKIEHQISTNCQAVPETLTHKVAFSRDGQEVAACDAGGVSVWNVQNESKLNTFQVKNGSPSNILFGSINGMLIVTSSRNPGSFRPGSADLEIIDMTSGKDLASFKLFQQYEVGPAVVNSTGDELAWPAASNEVQIYDLKARKSVTTLVVKMGGIYAGTINSLAFSPDNKTMAVSSSYYSGTTLVDIDSGKTISTPNNSAANVSKYSPDGKYFAAGWGGITVYYSSTFQRINALDTFTTYSTISFSPNSSTIAVGDGFLSLWDLQSKLQDLPNMQSFGWLFSFSPDGKQFVANVWNGSDWNHKIALYNLYGSQTDLPDITDPSSNWLITRPIISPSSDYVAINIGNNNIKIMSLASHQIVSELGTQFMHDMAFSPDGGTLATCGVGITFWDYAAGKRLWTFATYYQLNHIAYSPDGKLIAGTDLEGRALVWNADTRELIHEFADVKSSELVAFNPQGNMLATLGFDNASHAVLSAWDLTTGKLLYSITGSKVFSWGQTNPHADFTFSPDGSMIAVKGFSDYIEFIDATTGNIVKTLDAVKVDFVDQNDSDSFGFSADGRRFAVAGADGIVRIFIVQP